jgi:ribosomal protein S18 acetylase RimI-like enzyme
MNAARNVEAVEVRELAPAETSCAAGVLARGMRDNPLHVQAFGPDPEAREQTLTRMFQGVLPLYGPKGLVLGAFTSATPGETPETLVGVCGMVRPGRCQPAPGERLRLLPGLVSGSGTGGTARLLSWTGAWSRLDPPEPHWHLGPVGVERHLQGRGIGSALLRAFLARIAGERSVAYLETDKRENVRFYERFGFTVRVEAPVLGVPNWFMIRPEETS